MTQREWGKKVLVYDIVESSECEPPSAPGLKIYYTFSQNPDLLAIAVVEDGRLVGIINRARFFVRFSDTFGRAVYEKRPASPLMETKPLMVEASLKVAELKTLPLDSENSALLEGFIVVRGDQFAGISSVLSLYRCAAAAELKT
jgi:two-component system, cell cycle sensor histidine kinase PleC